jgi:hypothetical protein
MCDRSRANRLCATRRRARGGSAGRSTAVPCCPRGRATSRRPEARRAAMRLR